MPQLKVTITRFVDEGFPGFVECTFVDAQGETHCVIEKVPVITTDYLWTGSEYPREGRIACTVVARFVGAAGERLVRVDTELPYHIESERGETVFEVPESLVE
jgi:hypothetical protein